MLSAENVSQGSVRCVSFPQRNPLCPSRRVTRFPHAHRYALRVHCLFSAVVPPRGFWRGTQHPGVWAPRSPKPAACNRPPVPAAPCAPLVRPAGVCGRSAPQDSHVRCKYPGHLAPLSQEPPRGEASPLRPALVWLAREEHALSGAPELCVL